MMSPKIISKYVKCYVKNRFYITKLMCRTNVYTSILDTETIRKYYLVRISKSRNAITRYRMN